MGGEFFWRPLNDEARPRSESGEAREEPLPAPREQPYREQPWSQPDLFEIADEEEVEEAGPDEGLPQFDRKASPESQLPPDHPQRLLAQAGLAEVLEVPETPPPPAWEVYDVDPPEPVEPMWGTLVEPWPSVERQIAEAGEPAPGPELAEAGHPGDRPVGYEEPFLPAADTGEMVEASDVRLLADEELEEVGRQLVDVLDPEAWAGAEVAERMLLAQRAHACIREAYGLERSPLLYDLNLPPAVAGRFDPSIDQVSINASLLDEDHPGELLDTIAHENRHAVQVGLMQELHQAWDQGLQEPDRAGADWSTVAGWTEAWSRYDANDAVTYHSNELEVDARRAGLQLAGNGYWRAYMERMQDDPGSER